MKIREPDTDLEDHIQPDAGSGADEKKGERIVREDIQLGKEVLEIAMLCILHNVHCTYIYVRGTMRECMMRY